MKEFLAKRKAHLIFGGAFLLGLLLNIIVGFTPGQSVMGAIWNGVSEFRPMDYLMFTICWYSSAVYRPRDDWNTSLISLNLSQTNSEK